MRARARANANIALVKYWGKRDSLLNLPRCGSLSVTLDGMGTTTTVDFNATLTADEVWINGALAPEALPRAARILTEVRKRSG